MRRASKLSLALALAVSVLGSLAANSAGATKVAQAGSNPCLAMDQSKSAAPVRFAILPDRTGSERPEVFAMAPVTLNALVPDFVISVGDVIEGYTSNRDEVLSQWDEAEAVLSQVEAPLCITPGNHDVWDEQSSAIWAERQGPRYYAFRQGGALFMILDTEDPPEPVSPDLAARQLAMKKAWARDPMATQARILEAVKGKPPTQLPGGSNLSDEQVTWALETLDANKDVRWTFVVLHRPAWKENPNPLGRIEAELAKRKHTVIAGHEHYFEVFKRHGADYIVTATAGGVWLREGPGRLDHVLLIELAGEADAQPEILSVPLAERIAP